MLLRLAILGQRDDFRMIILSMARFFTKGTYYEPISRLKRLKKRPASTRLRSKKVARRATAAITAVGATTWLRPNEAMLLKGSINREKTVGSAANTCLRANDDELK